MRNAHPFGAASELVLRKLRHNLVTGEISTHELGPEMVTSAAFLQSPGFGTGKGHYALVVTLQPDGPELTPLMNDRLGGAATPRVSSADIFLWHPQWLFAKHHG